MGGRSKTVSRGESERYVYRTQGVCPPEIHLQIRDGVLEEVRFAGGGCPGNAQLVSRLLRGRPLQQLPDLLEGIPCREGTSCPDQLLQALRAAQHGVLLPARSFLICEDLEPKRRVGLIGHLGGDSDSLQVVLSHMREMTVEAVYCLGNLTGGDGDNGRLIDRLRQEKVLAIQGEEDWRLTLDSASEISSLDQEASEYLRGLPQALGFRLGERRAVGFFGGYLQSLPGFSDFEPFALEMNLVCNLTRYLQDEEVFPALEAMTPQFTAQIVLFGQMRKWGHWKIGGIDFISVGPARAEGRMTWGLLEAQGEEVVFQVLVVR